MSDKLMRTLLQEESTKATQLAQENKDLKEEVETLKGKLVTLVAEVKRLRVQLQPQAQSEAFLQLRAQVDTLQKEKEELMAGCQAQVQNLMGELERLKKSKK